MGFKDKMMDNMMGKMTAEEKKEMMDKMMDSFFSTMTKEEKQDMMNNMMPKMMEKMMGDGEQGQGGMMGMMGGKGSMMDMMSSMMSGKGSMMSMMDSMMNKNMESEDGSDFQPMDMCRKMMSTISQSSDIATFATPEIRQLFEEWVQQVDDEILHLVQDNNISNPVEIADKLKISQSSAIYFLSRLAQKGKVSINFVKAGNQTV